MKKELSNLKKHSDFLTISQSPVGLTARTVRTMEASHV